MRVPAAAGSRSGEQLYKAICGACHEAGVAGAPKTGDKAALYAVLGPVLEVIRITTYMLTPVMPVICTDVLSEFGFSDASKVALVALATQVRRWEFAVIDCQMETEHLIRMGATAIPRPTFLQLLDRYCPLPGRDGPWRLDADLFADFLPVPPL
jgi:hypothetical protein